MNEFRRLINIVSKNDSNRVLTENKDERKSAVNDATAIAERMIERYRDSNYTAYERAGDHAMSYDRDHPHQKYWLDVQNEINRIENEQKGVTEGSEGTLWRVERSEATGRYYVVKGYNKSRKIWKNKMGVGDFVDRKSAESKADELNKGVTEAKSPEEFINQLKSLDRKQPRITNTCRVCGKKWQLQHHCKGPSKNQDKGVAEGYSNTTFNVDRRKLNVPALIQKGAILVTHPHGEQGWETDNKEDWAFSLLSLYNVLQGGWASEAKKYLKPESYKRAEQQINSSAPNLGSDKLVYDGKYNQILWSIKKLGIPDNVAFLDKSQQGVAEEKLITQHKPGKCTQCGGPSYDDEQLAEEKDACYRKVKSRYRVWPSAYGSGALVKCRKVGAKNWGNKGKKK